MTTRAKRPLKDWVIMTGLPFLGIFLYWMAWYDTRSGFLKGVINAAGLLCVVFGIRNLKRTGHSPHWMWFAVFHLPGALLVFTGSLILLLNKWLAEGKRLFEQAEQEAQRKAQEEAYRRDAPRREAEERRQQEEVRRRQAAQHEAEQRASASHLTDLMSNSVRTTAELRNLVQAAENTVDLAEREFKGGFFVPFWDAVEQAANQLSECEAFIQRLIHTSNSYNEEAQKLDTPPPPLQLILPDASHTANRMRNIVRQSQPKIDFTTVYHQRELIFQQRKTNQLLAAGFTTLGQAINELGDRLDTSFERVTSSLDRGISEITARQDTMAAAQERFAQQTASADAARREHERKVEKQDASADHAQREHESKIREYNDDIRRGRKPFP